MKITLDSTIPVRAFTDNGGLARRLLLTILEGNHVLVMQSVATMVRPDPALVAPIRDPNDIVVLQTAIIGGAEAICTTDEDFFHTPALAFLKSVSILVFTDMELMGRLRS